jgi:hypothetical protein
MIILFANGIFFKTEIFCLLNYLGSGLLYIVVPFQEPGDEAKIKEFISELPDPVTFDMFSKVKVNGGDAHPLWKYLKKKQAGTITKLVAIIMFNFCPGFTGPNHIIWDNSDNIACDRARLSPEPNPTARVRCCYCRCLSHSGSIHSHVTARTQ